MPEAPRRYSPFGALRNAGLIRSVEKVRDERRGNSSERGYGSRWQASRAGFLQHHPLCCCCSANGTVRAATVVDHVEPHRGDMLLFWKRTNWQALCKECHDSVKKTLEARWDMGMITVADLRLDRPLPEFFALPPGG